MAFPPPAQIQSGIGRLILREEMKARSNSYADPWTPPRSSASSREALHTAGYEGSLNGCKDNPVHLSIPPGTAPAPVGSSLGWREKEQGTGKGWWERCWAPELDLGGSFPLWRAPSIPCALAGMGHCLAGVAVCPGSLVKCLMGWLKGPLGISQHSHTGFALTCFGLAVCVPPR